MKKLGLVHVYTGNGQGKTSAGMGLISRALGYGFKVKVIQLFKEKTGEKCFFEKNGVEFFQFKSVHPFFKEYNESEFADLKKEFSEFWKTVNDFENYDLVLIDEVGPGIKSRVVSEKFILDFINSKPLNTELILTGRDIPESIKEAADYVSEINEIKHPYKKNISAREGIEF